MNSPAPKPGLPTWLFVVSDLALVGAAAVIALRSPQPLSTQAMLAIVGCVGLGALIGLVPLVVRYERLKNEVLDDRQRALETLSRTVHESAQQISIATGSLNEIADLAQRNLRHAEHLPHKLQEKIAEFQAQLAEANDAEKVELEEELNVLRTSESERLESIATKVAKSAADWGKLEAATAQQLTAVTEAVARLPASAAEALKQIHTAADQALAEARGASARALAEAESNATRAVAAAHAAGLANLEAKVAECEKRLAAATMTATFHATGEVKGSANAALQSLDAKIARIASLVDTLQALAARLAETPALAANPPAAPAEPPSPPPGDEAAAADGPAAPTTTAIATPPAPKRQRRARKEEAPASAAAAPTPPTAAPEETSPPAAAIPPAPETESTTTQHPFGIITTPEELPPESLPATPAVDDTQHPFFLPPKSVAAPESLPATPAVDDTQHPFFLPPKSVAAPVPPPEPPAAPQPSPEPPSPPPAPRKRAARKPEPEPVSGLDLAFDESAPAATAGPVERTLTSDGATRLLATAYIGIGNRLFIRGDGPGLSWDRGVPLQFVSIGKWRWETNDASAPVRFKLYKNDEQECTALGEQTLEPGHLQEMTAAF